MQHYIVRIVKNKLTEDSFKHVNNSNIYIEKRRLKFGLIMITLRLKTKRTFSPPDFCNPVVKLYCCHLTSTHWRRRKVVLHVNGKMV